MTRLAFVVFILWAALPAAAEPNKFDPCTPFMEANDYEGWDRCMRAIVDGETGADLGQPVPKKARSGSSAPSPLLMQWTQQVIALQSDYQACKTQKELLSNYACVLAVANREFSVHEQLMDSTSPDTWPSTLRDRYVRTYTMKAFLPAAMVCENTPAIPGRDCLADAMGRNPDLLPIDANGAYMKKIVDRVRQMNAQQDIQHAHSQKELDLERERLAFQRQALQQQLDAQLEAARINAAGQALMGLGMSGGIFKTPPPVQPIQLAPITPLMMPAAPLFTPPPPVSCMSQKVGGVVSTNCY